MCVCANVIPYVEDTARIFVRLAMENGSTLHLPGSTFFQKSTRTQPAAAKDVGLVELLSLPYENTISPGFRSSPEICGAPLSHSNSESHQSDANL